MLYALAAANSRQFLQHHPKPQQLRVVVDFLLPLGLMVGLCVCVCVCV